MIKILLRFAAILFLNGSILLAGDLNSNSAEFGLNTSLQALKQVIIVDNLQGSSPEVIERLRNIEQAVSLLNDIVAEFNASKLAILKPSFEKLCGYPISIENLKLRDLRRFAAKLEKIETFIKNSCEEQKALFTKEDLVLCDKICLFCQILSSRIFDKQNFEFGAVDSFVDTVIFRPLDWIRKNPDVAIVSAIPVVLGTMALGVVFGDRLFGPGDEASDASPIDEKGFYIPSPLHIDGIPAGYCFDVNIEKQHHWDCVPASLAYLCQRYDNVPDTQTYQYRHERYREWGIEDSLVPQTVAWADVGAEIQRKGGTNYRQALKYAKEAELRGIIDLDYFALCNCKRHFRDNKDKIANYVYKYVEDNVDCKRDLVRELTFYIKEIFKEKKKFIETGNSVFVWFSDPNHVWTKNKVTGNLENIGIGHSVGYEVKRVNNNEKGFVVICYDSLRAKCWRVKGAAFLYKLFSSEKVELNDFCKEFLDDNDPVLIC